MLSCYSHRGDFFHIYLLVIAGPKDLGKRVLVLLYLLVSYQMLVVLKLSSGYLNLPLYWSYFWFLSGFSSKIDGISNIFASTDEKNPQKGVIVNMSATHGELKCSLSVSVLCDSQEAQVSVAVLTDCSYLNLVVFLNFFKC